MLILALLSQLVGAVAATLIAVRALRSPFERLLTHLPPAGASLARRWLLWTLIAIGVTSGIRMGMSPGMLGGPVWPHVGPGTPHLDAGLLGLAGLEALSGALGALRGLAFATLFLIGLSILGSLLTAERDRPMAGGRNEAIRRGGRDRRDLPLGPRLGPREDPRDRSGEPRRLPSGGGGGGRGRGPVPGRERREGPGREREGRGEGREREPREREPRDREPRESYREPVGSGARSGGSPGNVGALGSGGSGGPGFAGPARHGARPLPDPPAIPAAAGAPIVERGGSGRDPRDGRR